MTAGREQSGMRAGGAGAPRDPSLARRRMTLVIAAFAAAFSAISIRLVDLSFAPPPEAGPASGGRAVAEAPKSARPTIVDRNGHMLATDIQTASLFADARRVIDVDEAIELLTPVLPGLGVEDLRRKLSSGRRFVWIKRELTPRQQSAIHNLGIPAFGFRTETRRVYPTGRTAAHVLGHVNVDNQGIAGIEKFIDLQRREQAGSGESSMAKKIGGTSGGPVELSIDLRVQHAVRDELLKAMEEHRAIGAAGIVLDVRTGEVIAMTSLPDYDPNAPAGALEQKRMNRVTAGVYELGSTFKALTIAMALDAGTATMESRFDARAPIRVGRFRIGDFRGKNRVLSLPEVLIYSSNIGTARMALQVGVEGHRAFLERLHMFERLQTELPESALPLWPRDWKPVNSMTIAFGHGLSVTPLHLAAAGAALVNGGDFIAPTLLKRDGIGARAVAEPVIGPETSASLRALLKMNVERGTATRAKVEGYAIGGKTGTAEKTVNGRYSKNARLTSFLGTFPVDRPRYMLLVVLDEPKPSEKTHGYATSGWNAAPAAGRIIRRIAPMLGILPRLENRNPFGDAEVALN